MSADVSPGFRVQARDVWLIARFEWAEALRSKLLIVVTLMFVGAGALGAWGFSEMVSSFETNAAQVTGAPTTQRRGGTLRRLRQSGSYRDMLRLFLRDNTKADYFAEIPPIVVFYGFVSFLFTPWLVLFNSAETIASERSSRAIRFALLRTRKFHYALGKALGQALILVAVTALSAAVFYFVAWLQLDAFEGAATAFGMLGFLPRVIAYALPFLGWAMFASMLTSSANLARVLALGGAVLLAIVNGVAHSTRLRNGVLSSSLLDLLGTLTPFGHNDGLFYPPSGTMGSDLAICLALTVLYFAAGFAVFRRRDV